VRSDGLAELQVAAEPRLVEAVKPPPFQAADVEAILAGQTRVREAAVIQQADDAGKAQLVAFVEMDTPPKDSLRTEAKVQFEASIKHSLPSAAMVSAIRYVDAMPRDASGHVDREALQERWRLERRLPPHAMQAYRFSLDTLEEISSLWKRLLQNDAIGYDEDFFDAGGTPVRLIRMHAELNRRFPGAISMGQLSVLTSIRKIHEHLLKYYAEQGRASLHRRGA
jgi:isopentenyl diphosphate isomerase/L-lactate dehydrogenase-like FMN-dependent dehydrogenase